MEQTLILAAVFFVVSTVFSMIGMGGGILYVPILLLAGFSMKQAPGISLILISATSLAALSTFWKNKKVDWKLALVIDPPTDVMAFVGGYFSASVQENVLTGILAGVLILAGGMMLRNRSPLLAARVHDANPWYWHRQFNGASYAVNVPLVVVATALVGALSGMLGITGGIIKLPIMVLLCGVPMDIAVATSTIMVAVTALSGLVGHAASGPVSWHTGLVLAVAALFGGLLGSRISLKISKTRLKRVFGIVIWLMAVRLLVRLCL